MVASQTRLKTELRVGRLAASLAQRHSARLAPDDLQAAPVPAVHALLIVTTSASEGVAHARVDEDPPVRIPKRRESTTIRMMTITTLV